MPISKSPLEYYRYYCASQRRVEQWVQDTGQTIPSSPAQSETQWRGFLEDPCLATPISLPPPLDHRREPKHESEDRRLAGVLEQESQVYPQYPTPEIDHAHDIDHDIPHATSQRRPSVTTTPKGTHDDSTRLQRSRAGTQRPRSDEKPVGDLVPALPSSSKHSKDSKQSRHTSKSKNSSSSSSRKRKEAETRRSVFAYVPYGIIPLLFAMTTGSSAVSLATASIMLAGFFCLDYTSTVSSSFGLSIFKHSSELPSTGGKKKISKVTKLHIMRVPVDFSQSFND